MVSLSVAFHQIDMVWSGCDLRCGRVHTCLCHRRDTQSERAAIDDQLRDVCHEQVYHLELMYIVFVNGDPLQVSIVVLHYCAAGDL